MTSDQFTTATDRIRRERGMTLAEIAAAIGVTAYHISHVRKGFREASLTTIMALRALSAGAPKMPEEG